jgi:hypothetical protein
MGVIHTVPNVRKKGYAGPRLLLWNILGSGVFKVSLHTNPANPCEGRISYRRDDSAGRSEICHQFRRRYSREGSSEFTIVSAQRASGLRGELLVLLVVDLASVLVGFSIQLKTSLGMTDKTYLVRLKPRELGLHVVIAASAEIHGEHIVLLNSDRKLAALFLLEIVETWTETGCM